MAEEFDKKLLDRLAHIEIAIQSINPDPAQTIQAHRDQRDPQQRAADQLVVATQALVAMTRRLAIATWALVGVTAILAVAAVAPFTINGTQKMWQARISVHGLSTVSATKHVDEL